MSGAALNRRSPSWNVLLALGVAALAACGKKGDEQAAVDIPAPQNVTTPRDIGTEIGNGRALESGTTEVSTATQWSRVVPFDKSRATLGGQVEGLAVVMTTSDGGRSFQATTTPAQGELTWSVGVDSVAVLSVARRRQPKKPLAVGAIAPIDSLALHYAVPGEGISPPVALLSPDDKDSTPTVPSGSGMAAVLGPSLGSVVVELAPRRYAVAFAKGPGEPLPTPIALPAGEAPVHAPYSRPPQLVTSDGKRLLRRPWPRPDEALSAPTPIEGVVPTPALLQELSKGPECESAAASYRRVELPGRKPAVFAGTAERWLVLELPATTIAQSPIGCTSDRVVVEAINPEGLPALVTCSLTSGCFAPQNRPFLRPWSEPHDRKLSIAFTSKGVAASLSLRTKSKWGLYVSSSSDGGRLYDLERRVGYGEGNVVDGHELGVLLGMGDRTLLLMSAKIAKTTRRGWYVLASEDGGSLWSPP
jgi:hypothetical protein